MIIFGSLRLAPAFLSGAFVLRAEKIREVAVEILLLPGFWKTQKKLNND
jgi:hypothetical protein